MGVTHRINSTIYSDSDFLVLWWKDTTTSTINRVVKLEELTCFNVGERGRRLKTYKEKRTEEGCYKTAQIKLTCQLWQKVCI